MTSTATKNTPQQRRSRRLYVGVFVAAWLLDLATKSLAVSRLEPHQPVPVLGQLLQLNLIRNPGAAFSIGESFTIVFTALAIAVLCYIVLRLLPRLAHSLWALALGLLSAGICGNLTDRIFRPPGPFRGHVVDFLQLPHWPIFNVADMCVTSAAVLIMWCAMVTGVGFDGVREKDRQAGEAAREAAGEER